MDRTVSRGQRLQYYTYSNGGWTSLKHQNQDICLALSENKAPQNLRMVNNPFPHAKCIFFDSPHPFSEEPNTKIQCSWPSFLFFFGCPTLHGKFSRSIPILGPTFSSSKAGLSLRVELPRLRLPGSEMIRSGRMDVSPQFMNRGTYPLVMSK
jgi:hypothetical protein